MAPPNIKGVKVIDAINKYPELSDRHIARKVGCTANYVKMVRNKMAHVAVEMNEVEARIEANRHEVPKHQQHLIMEHEWDGVGDHTWCRHGIDYNGEPCEVCSEEDRKALLAQEEPMLPLDLTDAPTQQDLDEALHAASVLSPSTLDAVLNERGSRYGSFIKHAIITQRIKAVMSDTPNWIALNDDMVEALEMIAHKIGRILNGDPTYADSWVDIAGYAQLVADRLQGKER